MRLMALATVQEDAAYISAVEAVQTATLAELGAHERYWDCDLSQAVEAACVFALCPVVFMWQLLMAQSRVENLYVLIACNFVLHGMGRRCKRSPKPKALATRPSASWRPRFASWVRVRRRERPAPGTFYAR